MLMVHGVNNIFNILFIFHISQIMVTYENLTFNLCFPPLFDKNQFIFVILAFKKNSNYSTKH